jgi:hypothetical protein
MVKIGSWLNGKGRIKWAEQLLKSSMAHGYHKRMLDIICKCFPCIPRDVVALQTNELDVCGGHYVDITAEIWDDVIDLLNVVEVTQRVDSEMASPVLLPLDSRALSSPDNQSAPGEVNEQDSS